MATSIRSRADSSPHAGLSRSAVGTSSILFLRDPDRITVELVERDSGVFR
jgi:hypothetical protein